MTRPRKALVVGFGAVQVFAALWMVMASVHGPSGLSTAALAYVVIAPLATWFAARRIRSPFLFSAAALAVLALVPALFATTAGLENIIVKRRIARTRVTDVRDEPIVSATGQTIGVRVSYSVTVPGRGYFAILPSLAESNPRGSSEVLYATRWTIDGSRDPVPFEPGKTHAMVVELYPSILVFPRGERCLAHRPIPTLTDSVPAPLRLAISDTPYGDVYSGKSEQITRNSYSLARLYRGVLAEGLAPCKTP